MRKLDKVLEPWVVSGPTDVGEYRAYCPYHEDPKTSKSPSASFNPSRNIWNCQGCDNGGTLTPLVRDVKAGKIGKAKGNVTSLDQQRAAKGKAPSEKQVEAWHRYLLRKKPEYVSGYLQRKRGLSMEVIKKYQIGYDREHRRFTIPIRDAEGDIVNVRCYSPRERQKMLNTPGCGSPARLYGFDTLEDNDEVVFCEGEWDRLCALSNGIPAVTHTGGSKVFRAEWAPYFKGKVVYFTYDNDTAGELGARKAAAHLKETAKAGYYVDLETGIDGGDVTDFFVKLGRDVEEFRRAMRKASVAFEPEEEHVVATEGTRVSVQESFNADLSGPLELIVMVKGKSTAPTEAPRRLKGFCQQDQGNKCTTCPFAAHDGTRTIDLKPDDGRLLRFLDASQQRVDVLKREVSGAHCNKVMFADESKWTIEKLLVAPSVEHRGEDVEQPIEREVYAIGTYKTPVNQLVRLVGRQTADPRNSRAIFHSWHLEQVGTDIDKFQMTPQLFKRLKRFRPTDGESPLEKCKAIADDLEANVTHIYGRPLLHIGFDLVWHSVTSFDFQGEHVRKGWLECLVIGDTRTGKSETATAMAKHYGAGVVRSLESASLPGLVGGASQPDGKTWMVSWGLLPLNDRRLVVLDEMSGLYSSGNRESKGILENMSSIRSDGKAQITKIAHEETSARTRIIWISNPLSSVPIHESSGGALPALRDLVRNPEDIARFDYVMAAAGNDVPSSVINSTKHRRVAHRYTDKLCHELIMWAWSRRADQIKFAKGIEEYIYAAAETLGSRYVPDPPLVQTANVRVKVARIAVALAARTFSSDARGECIVVRKSHVKDAMRFLDAIYSDEAMGYKRASDRVFEDRKKAEKAKEEARKYLRNNPHLIEVLLAVSHDQFRKRDFEDFGGMDREEASVILPKMLVWRLISRKSKGYLKMEPALVELLRELEAEGG